MKRLLLLSFMVLILAFAPLIAIATPTVTAQPLAPTAQIQQDTLALTSDPVSKMDTGPQLLAKLIRQDGAALKLPYFAGTIMVNDSAGLKQWIPYYQVVGYSPPSIQLSLGQNAVTVYIDVAQVLAKIPTKVVFSGITAPFSGHDGLMVKMVISKQLSTIQDGAEIKIPTLEQVAITGQHSDLSKIKIMEMVVRSTERCGIIGQESSTYISEKAAQQMMAEVEVAVQAIKNDGIVFSTLQQAICSGVGSVIIT